MMVRTRPINVRHALARMVMAATGVQQSTDTSARHMGGRALQDEVDASRYITADYHIPPARIGMYGGSYGGFMTLMALFTAPDYFGAGAALRAVTDWSQYNNGYTSAILNLPQNDTIAYRRSSPIHYAAGLRAPLLMAHGMVDTNVNYEDIVRLEQRLIELGTPTGSLLRIRSRTMA